MMPIVSFAPFVLFSFSLSFLLFIHFFISASFPVALLLLRCSKFANLPALLVQWSHKWSERGEYRIAPCCCCSKFSSAVGLQRSEESTVSAPQKDQLHHGAVEAKCTCSPPTSRRLCDSSKDIAWLHPTTATCVVFARWSEEQAASVPISSLVHYKTSHLYKYEPFCSGYNRSGRIIRYIRAAVSLAPHHWPPGS